MGSHRARWLVLIACLWLLTGCRDTEVKIRAGCQGGSQDGRLVVERYDVGVEVVRSFSESPPTQAQFALLVPTSWLGFETQTTDAAGNPFVHNGTELKWSASQSVADKAAARRPPGDSRFHWVGFETNEFTPDPAVTTVQFIQSIVFGFAPTDDLAGAQGLLIFVGDRSGANDRLRVFPIAACPPPIGEGVTVAIGDVDGDEFVDTTDVAAILAARGTHAALGDPRDIDGDGTITVNDARLCALLATCRSQKDPLPVVRNVTGSGSACTLKDARTAALIGIGIKNCTGQDDPDCAPDSCKAPLACQSVAKKRDAGVTEKVERPDLPNCNKGFLVTLTGTFSCGCMCRER